VYALKLELVYGKISKVLIANVGLVFLTNSTISIMSKGKKILVGLVLERCGDSEDLAWVLKSIYRYPK
jgi:hypothetical protein